jgi:hypothetical protein
MLKKLIFLSAFGMLFLNGFAQDLLSPSFQFSHKKTSYITSNKGELKGVLDKVKRKKGLILYVRLTDESGRKQKLLARDIKYMYLPPSGLDKLSKAMDFLHDAQKWTNEKLNQNLLHQGYVYFEQSNVKIKRKELCLMMQLLNPTFSKTVKVYHDPFAKHTASLDVGGVTVAGGIAKSYFVKIGDGTAVKLTKSDYKKEFSKFWGNCRDMQGKKDVAWKDFPKHVVEYTDCAL